VATTAKWGAKALGAYTTYSSFKDYAQQFKDGVGLRTLFMNIAIDAAINYAGGKALKLACKGLTKVAKAARKGAKKLGDLAENRHHAWPKFLGGAPGGNTIKIPVELHKKFHDKLYKRLQKHFGKSCRGWSTKQWDDFLKEDPERMRIMWEELIGTTTELDKELGGVNVINALFDQMEKQL
jgi:hypothetical protein